eukprot:scaffold5682_cov140-Cylindrotheca_fusiformis.AAC.22
MIVVSASHNGVESSDFIRLWKKESAPEKSVIHLQTTMMNHLNDNGITTSLPQHPTSTDVPIPASIHEMPVHSKDNSPCELVLRLFSWVPGRTMDSVKMLPLETLADAGRYLGRMSQYLGSLNTEKLAAARRFHQWDGKNTCDIKNFIKYVDDPARRAMVQSVVDTFQKELIDSKVADSFPVALIHADFNDANILLDEDCRVSGVIDFGDSVERCVLWACLVTFGAHTQTRVSGFCNHRDQPIDASCRGSCSCASCWTLHIYEQNQNRELKHPKSLAIIAFPVRWRVYDDAMAYAMLTSYGKRNRGVSAAAAFLRGYSSVCTLTDEELKHLVLLIACRLSCSVTLGAYSFKQAPENEYLLLHAKPGWDALGLIWGTDIERRKEMRVALDQIFAQACSSSGLTSADEVIDCSDLSFPDPPLGDPFSGLRKSFPEREDVKRQRVA